MGKEDKKDTRSVMVIQSNKLIEAYYDDDLTATEHKLIRYAASKIKKPEDFPHVTFTVQEFLEVSGVKGNSYYERFEKIADELSRKRIKIKHEDTTGYFPYLQAIIYKDGVVHLTFNNYIKPMLLQLKKEYTTYDYRYIGDMRSSYTIRIFELLRQYVKIGHRRIKVDTLRKMLGLGNKYKQYGQFKLRVLKQAQKELDEKEGLTFTFNEIKTGRKVTELAFHIKTKKDVFIAPSKKEEQFVKEVMYLLESYPFDIPQDKIKEWQGYSIDLIKDAFDAVVERNMDNPFAYITAVLKQKQKELKEFKAEIKSSDPKKVKKIKEFIDFYKQDKIPPSDFMLKYLFENKMSQEFSEKEALEMWEMDGEYILETLGK